MPVTAVSLCDDTAPGNRSDSSLQTSDSPRAQANLHKNLMQDTQVTDMNMWFSKIHPSKSYKLICSRQWDSTHYPRSWHTAYLEVLPFLKFIQVAVCNHDFGAIGSFCQTLVILHKLICFIDSEKLLNKQNRDNFTANMFCRKLNSYNKIE